MKKNPLPLILMTVVCFLLAAALIFFPDAGTKTDAVKDTFPYDLKNPEKIIELPGKLREISGLTFWNDSTLAGVQDEDGYVFFIDINSGEILGKEKFAKNGDYEGIAKAKKKLYISRSDGDIFKVKHLGEEDVDSKKYETDLRALNDIEGLCFVEPNLLLLACKERAGIDESRKKHKAVFAFDLDKNKLIEEPYLDLKVKDIDEKYEAVYGKELKKNFYPSGIAQHPNGTFYMVSGPTELILICDKSNAVLDIHELPSRFPQAEGIAFNSNALMAISTESRDQAIIALYELK